MAVDREDQGLLAAERGGQGTDIGDVNAVARFGVGTSREITLRVGGTPVEQESAGLVGTTLVLEADLGGIRADLAGHLGGGTGNHQVGDAQRPVA